MKLFMLKATMIAAVMFISVLFGMQQASNGINKMKGYENAQFEGAFSLQDNEEGKLEVSILGNDVSSHDLEKKKAEIEEIRTYNFFSSLGKKVADMVSFTTEKIIDLITGLA